MADMVRKHTTLPRKLAEDFEKLVGERNQSVEIAAMIERRLKTDELRDAFEKLAVSPRGEHPEWETAESRANWIDEMRKGRNRDEMFGR